MTKTDAVQSQGTTGKYVYPDTNGSEYGNVSRHTGLTRTGQRSNERNEENPLLQAALRYAEELSFSIIPVKGSYYSQGMTDEERARDGERPLIRWEPFQKRKADANEIRSWWEMWPNANIGIVTGIISNLAVIDIDTEDGKKAIREFVPDDLIVPICTTAKGGQHWYFECPDDVLKNNAKKVTGCDFRANGGYVVAPPSVNGNGYVWLPGLSPFTVTQPVLPAAYIDFINNKAVRRVKDIRETASVVTPMFANGRRDEDLFHTAYCSAKGGMQSTEIFQVLANLMKSWGEPVNPEWINEKIQSVFKRLATREKSLSEEVTEWILSSSGIFMSSEVARCLHVSSRDESKNLSKIFSRLCKDGVIERHGEKHGCFRRIDDSAERIDYINAPTRFFDIKWPFGIERYVQLMPKNIVIVAGASNSGKTAFLLNVVYNNMRQHDIHYFSSEMGSAELRDRLSRFDIPLPSWNFSPKERESDFADVIRPDAVNIIDFLELHDDFYKVGGYIKDIHHKLNKGIAIIALQKNADKDHGLGGARSIEKARLYLAMDHGRIKIVKGKIWTDKRVNPNGLVLPFGIERGCNFITTTDWTR